MHEASPLAVKPHEAASTPSLQCLCFQIIQPLFPKMQLQQPEPCRRIYSQSLAPKKALLSLLALAQKHKPRALRFSHAPRQSLRIPCIASRCLEIQTQPTWMCNFALLLPQLLLHQGWRAHFRREALAEPGGNGQPMTGGSQGHSQWVLSLNGALDIFMNFPTPGGSKQLTGGYSSSKISYSF